MFITNVMTEKTLITLIVFFLSTIIFAQDKNKLDNELIAILDTIFHTDQNQLGKLYRIQDEYGYESDKAKAASAVFDKNHLIHLNKVETILNERGWLGSDIVGDQGNRTLYIIIQHSELEIQLKYLPMMREATKNGNVLPRDLAHLEDRIASKTEKLQIYGSTIKRYSETGILDVWPVIDPKNIDERRLSVGLEPIAENLKRFGLDWNLERQIRRTAEFEKQRNKKEN